MKWRGGEEKNMHQINKEGGKKEKERKKGTILFYLSSLDMV